MLREGKPTIIAFWHGRLGLCVRLAPEGRRIVAVISANRDGELYARLLGRFGIEAVRGSTANPRKSKDKKGRDAFHGAIKALREGAILGITPDGPRGPRMRAQQGVAAISAITGATVIPATMSTARARTLSTWDRFLAPLPFDRGVGLFGGPIPPPSTDDPEAVEEHRRVIEEALNALTAEADRRVGRAPAAPAER